MKQSFNQDDLLSTELEESFANELDEEVKNETINAIKNEWDSLTYEERADNSCWIAELNDVYEKIHNNEINKSEALGFQELLREIAESRQYSKS